jgi:hypothetical protein
MGDWKNLHGVSDPHRADWFIVVGDYDPVSLPFALTPARTIYIQRELPANGYLPPPIQAAHTFNYDNSHCAGIWWVDRPFDEMVWENDHGTAEHLMNCSKSRFLTAITTAKRQTAGQKMRYSFLERFHKAAPGVMDVWGIDESELRESFGDDYRGPLPYNGPGGRHGDKFRGMKDYQFAFCFENCCQRNYFSEKLLDAYLSWCMPLYWGCPNLTDYFPEDSFYWIDIENFQDDPSDIRCLKVGTVEADAVREARQRILFEYNLWEMVHKVL